MITIENADKALKEYYLAAVNAQLNDNVSPFFSAIEKSTENVYGKDVRLAVIKGLSGNIMAGDEDGQLPDPYSNRYLSISVPLKNIYGTISISDKSMRASRESSGAFVNLLNAEMEGLISSAKQNFQRMLFGNGSGSLCGIIEPDLNNENIFKVDVVKDYFVGMQVDLIPSTGKPISEGIGVYITAIDKVKKTITIDQNMMEVVDGGWVVPHGSYKNELTGLDAIFSESTLYGYEKANEPYFAPYKLDCAKSLTEEKLADILDHMEENFNSKVNMIICSFKTRRKIAALIADNRRVTNSIDARTGVGVVSVNDVPVYADKYCPDGRIYFLNTEDFVLCQLCDWEWLEDEDGKIIRQIQGKPAYGATLVKYAELICKKPCGQAMLYNIE